LLQKSNTSFIGSYLRLLGTIRPYLGALTAAVLCMLLLAASTGVYAWAVGPLLKFLVSQGDLGGQEILKLVPGIEPQALDRRALLVALPLFIVAVALVKGLSYFGQFYLMGLVGQKVVADLRQRMFERLLVLEPAFYQRMPTGQILSRFTSDVYAVEQAVTFAFAAYLRDSLQVVVLLVLAFLVLPAALVPIVYFGKGLRSTSQQSQYTLGTLADRLQQSISAMRIVQVFGGEESESRRFAGENRRYLRVMLRSFAVRALQSPVMEFLGALGLAATIWYAGSRVLSGELDPGHFVSFFAAALMLYNPMKSLGRMGDVVAGAVAAAERLFELLDREPQIADRPGALAMERARGELEFEGVGFSYGERPVLRDISFRARSGEVIALVGPSGAGKSTLVNLIPRFYDVSAGCIRLDGIDIRDLRLRDLRRQIALVTQETVLFNDTVAANIAFGSEGVSRSRLVEVARQANALEFIEALPRSFDTVIGEGGVRLSVGQRQRLAIARALLKDAPLLILDEATSALDSESEMQVQSALDRLIENRTVLVIAHRLSTVFRADCILVLQDGRLVERGRHSQLVQAGGLYQRLFELQFKQ
jgi:subfamily B ATP-binding cassette protein MsbA